MEMKFFCPGQITIFKYLRPLLSTVCIPFTAAAGSLPAARGQGSVRLCDLPGGHEDWARHARHRVRVLRLPPLPGLQPTARAVAGELPPHLHHRPAAAG
jgi:hypothetical protein